MGKLLAMSQVGMEMVAPVVLGLAADYYFQSSPIGAIVGVFVGFFGGMAHLLHLATRKDDGKSRPPKKTGGTP